MQQIVVTPFDGARAKASTVSFTGVLKGVSLMEKMMRFIIVIQYYSGRTTTKGMRAYDRSDALAIAWSHQKDASKVFKIVAVSV